MRRRLKNLTGTSESRWKRPGPKSAGVLFLFVHAISLTECSDFGTIFGELLPGNFAKLQPPEGQDLMDGLEVKVQLGSVWKQSLTELSGGQRCVLL